MMDARNLVVLSGGITRDPEVINGKILKLGLGVDYASNDKDQPSGYFDITYFLSNETQNTKFVKGQLDAGHFKKGTAISVVGRLQQERWERDGQKNSKVVIIAESISYFGRKPAEGGGGAASNGTPAAKPAAAPDEELLPAPADF